jgi:hypothetical protein
MTALQLREVAIERWMLAIIRNGGVQRHDDLHIDQIDKEWRSESTWVAGGLEAFKNALVVRDRRQLDYTVALAFSLRSGREPIGITFSTVEDISEQLDWSPPSLYLFRIGQEPWLAARNSEWNNLERLDCGPYSARFNQKAASISNSNKHRRTIIPA